MEDKFNYSISAKSNELTTILPTVIGIVHRKSFSTVKIGFPGMERETIRTTAKTTGRQRMNHPDS
jgi:hypothetical protein